MEGFSLFSDLSPADCVRIACPATAKRYWRHQIAFSQGEPADEVLVLVCGCIKTVQKHRDAHVILKLHRPGEIVGASNCLDSNPHFYTGVAVENSTVLAWDADIFEYLVERIPTLRRNLTHALQDCLAEIEQRFRALTTEGVGSRLSGELSRLAERLGLEITISQAELAQLTGTTSSTVNRFLCQWEALGIVEIRRRAVLIKDVAALQRIAESE